MSAFHPLPTFTGRSTIVGVIALTRQYLSTLIVLGAGLFWSAPLPLIAAGVLVAFFVDLLLIGPTADLALYRVGLNLDATAPRRLGGVRLHLVAILVAAALVLIPYVAEANASVQQAFGMAAILVGTSAASYGGLLRFGVPSTPRDLLTDVDAMPYPLVLLDLLPTQPRRLIGVLVRISLGLFAMLPFVAVAGIIHREPFRAPMLLVVPALAAFFQLGFVTWLAGLFLLRWRRGPARET